MKVDLFDFDLPKEYIAHKPVKPRDCSKLLDLRNDVFVDRFFKDLPYILNPGDLLIVNDTRVIPARLFGFRTKAKIEITLHKQISLDTWLAFAKPAKRLKNNNIIIFEKNFNAKVIEKKADGEVVLEFNIKGNELLQAIHKNGFVPLPPYIKRDNNSNEDDKNNYQTIYAKNEGAVAAPTAGLHFTDEVLSNLKKNSVSLKMVTLHVGAGTFLPVKVDDTRDHKMHSEFGYIDKKTADLINITKKKGQNVIAVGTTVLRLLETATGKDGIIRPFNGETNIFITPGYKFNSANILLTNFHLPKSTLFMLVSAFAGLDKMQKAYSYAKLNKYRFYSYGDCCILKSNKL